MDGAYPPQNLLLDFCVLQALCGQPRHMGDPLSELLIDRKTPGANNRQQQGAIEQPRILQRLLRRQTYGTICEQPRTDVLARRYFRCVMTVALDTRGALAPVCAAFFATQSLAFRVLSSIPA